MEVVVVTVTRFITKPWQGVVYVMYNVHTGQLGNDHIHVRVVFMDC